ncbi:MAG: Carbon-nitrogen family hydrolase [Actinomycetota bacterium]|nr:Carbon-nitrogen family hydrolase [Actinomycetota bacterium]
MVTVALVQVDLTTSDPTRPRQVQPVEVLIREAAEDGAEFIVLPELWRTGPFELEATLGAAEPLTGPTAQAMAGLAAELGVWLHAGSMLELDLTDGADRRFNTSLLFGPTGDLVATYRKRHLFGFDTGEAALIDAGDEFVVVDTPLGRTGLATCYDLRFPEHFRALVDAGAESIVLTSGWPEVRIGHWTTLTAARAIEDQVNLLACNATGASGQMRLGGSSAVIDPWGAVVAQAGNGPQTLLAHVAPTAPGRARTEFPVLRDRR